MINNCCETCNYWVRNGIETKTGFCHRYPPTLSIQLVPRPGNRVIGGAQQVNLEPINLINWPTTKEIDFCGEHFNDES